jgi:hypothetical protein
MAYQMMKGKKDNNGGFPPIPGTIARYSALGLTNEEMSKNPVWVDKTGNGHDLQMKNFAWKGMSGVGGVSTYYDKYEFTPDKYYMVAVSSGTQHAQFTFKVTGLVDGNILSLADTSSPSNVYGKWTQDGIYTVDIDVITDRSLYFYNGVSATRGEFTIEILPPYPGFILGDGVDDFAVTEKELNFEDTYTVYTAFIPFQNNPTRNMILCGADSKKTFSMQYSSLVYVSFIAGNNYYVNADFVNGLNLFACKRNGNNICIKNLLTNKVVTGTCGDWVENAGLYYLWKNATYASFARAAIAGQTICNGHYSTDEEDAKVLAWYKKEYPWLFPDQAWTVTGKTNEDKDRATIANITGNGNKLVLSNFGFIEGSGYNKEGEYAGYLVTDGVDDRIGSSIFEIGKDFTIIGEWKFMDNIIANVGISKAPSLFVYNTNNGLRIFINNTTKGPVLNTKTLKAICSDGRVYSDDWSEMIVNEEQPITSSKSSLLIGINGNNFAKIALKNLAIYNQILSKDDCIKAYNYLQSLKAK